VLDYVQMKEREAAGVERATVSFGLAVESSLGCRLEHVKRIRGCTGSWRIG
jgi:hypothetical protein